MREILNKDSIVKEYERWYLPLGMFVLRIVEDSYAAEDIVHNIFLRVMERFDAGERIEKPRQYLYQAARNGALQYLKSIEKEAPMDFELNDTVSEEWIDTSERDAALWRGIDALPEKCREIFLLSKRDGWSHAEIADEFGISVKTVENQITKAFRKLRQDDNLKSILSNNYIFFLPFL